MRPTSTWKGLPLVTFGSRVTVETNRESMAFERPFLMSKSSIGERQSVGGAVSLTIPKAARRSFTWSGFNKCGLSLGANPAFAMISCARGFVTEEKVCLRKYRSGVLAPSPSLGTFVSRSSRCNVPISNPCGWGLMSLTGRGSSSVTRGHDASSMSEPSSS